MASHHALESATVNHLLFFHLRAAVFARSMTKYLRIGMFSLYLQTLQKNVKYAAPISLHMSQLFGFVLLRVIFNFSQIWRVTCNELFHCSSCRLSASELNVSAELFPRRNLSPCNFHFNTLPGWPRISQIMVLQ
jgi:hypothetical protein